MNVVITKTYYSLRAVLAAIEKLEIASHYGTNPAVKTKFETESDNGITLLVEMSRPGYSSVGYHVGTEVCVFAIPVLDHASLFEDTSCITFEIDPLVCDFNNAKVVDMWSPEPEEGPDECGEGYFPPDDDFWWDTFNTMFINPIAAELEKGELEYVFSKTHPHDGSPGRFWLFTGDDDFIYNLDSPDPYYARENLLAIELP